MTPSEHPYDDHDAEYLGGRKLCPSCEAPIAERQQTCTECVDPDEQCRCGAPTNLGPYGTRYSVCDDCADVTA